MEASLVLEIKEHIGYTEEKRRCDQCQYYKETENPYVDRMWDESCTYSNLGSFRVEAAAHCSKFSRKE